MSHRMLSLAIATLISLNGCVAEKLVFPEELAVEVGPASSSLTVGQSIQLRATIGGTDAGSIALWESAVGSVATVSGSGIVTGVAPGTAVVTATVDGFRGTAMVEVAAAEVPPTQPPVEPAPTEPVPTQPVPTEPPPPTTTPSSGLAELPRVRLNTRYVAPVGGTTRTVRAGDDLQAALIAAVPGDVIVLAAGATFTGNFILPAKDPLSEKWIIVRTSALDALPAEGTRVTPAHAASMAKLLSVNADPALRTGPGAHRWRFIGLEITANPPGNLNYGLVALGNHSQTTMSEVPHNLIFDRNYIHGTPTLGLSRCVALNSASTAIIESYLSDCHLKGFDSQAIGGWNGPGPFKIANNYLEGAGENVMFGGAPASLPGLIASDIEFVRNHLRKPLSWRGVWTVKNLFETKNVQRILVEGNIFENNWADGQDGFGILLKSSDDGPWAVSKDITFRNNLIVNSTSGVSIADQASSYTPGRVARIVIENNLFEGLTGRLFQMIDETNDVAFIHNTGFPVSHIMVMDGAKKYRTRIEDNLIARGSYGIFGSGSAEGTGSLTGHIVQATMRGNVIIGGSASIYPTGNYFPATTGDVGFVNFAGGNYRLSSTSPYLGRASGGTNPGANLDAVMAATAGVRSP